MFESEFQKVDRPWNHQELIEDQRAIFVVPSIRREVKAVENEHVGIKAIMGRVERFKAGECPNPGGFTAQIPKFSPDLRLEIVRQDQATAIAA